MAAVTMTTVAAGLVSGVADTATATGLTQANVLALAAIVSLLAQRNGDFLPLHKLINDTHKAQLVPG